LEIAESIQLCDFRVGQASTGAEAQLGYVSHDATSPLLSPIFPPTSVFPLFNEGLGYHDGKIVELKIFVVTF